MTAERFRESVVGAWGDLWQRLGCIPPARMLVPMGAGKWTVKDVIAHITWHERQMIGLLEGRALVGSPWWGSRATSATH
jgi:hypothetical protein